MRRWAAAEAAARSRGAPLRGLRAALGRAAARALLQLSPGCGGQASSCAIQRLRRVPSAHQVALTRAPPRSIAMQRAAPGSAGFTRTYTCSRPLLTASSSFRNSFLRVWPRRVALWGHAPTRPRSSSASCEHAVRRARESRRTWAAAPTGGRARPRRGCLYQRLIHHPPLARADGRPVAPPSRRHNNPGSAGARNVETTASGDPCTHRRFHLCQCEGLVSPWRCPCAAHSQATHKELLWPTDRLCGATKPGSHACYCMVQTAMRVAHGGLLMATLPPPPPPACKDPDRPAAPPHPAAAAAAASLNPLPLLSLYAACRTAAVAKPASAIAPTTPAARAMASAEALLPTQKLCMGSTRVGHSICTPIFSMPTNCGQANGARHHARCCVAGRAGWLRGIATRSVARTQLRERHPRCSPGMRAPC